MSEYVAYLHMTSLPKKDKKCHYIRENKLVTDVSQSLLATFQNPQQCSMSRLVFEIFKILFSQKVDVYYNIRSQTNPLTK